MPKEGSPKSFVPTGTPARFENRDYLRAIEVDNRVMWVNKDMLFPFNLNEGERADLGLFLTTAQKTTRESLPLIIMNEHNRSGLLIQAVFEDTGKRRYRDVNLKGIGGTGWSTESPTRVVMPPDIQAETPGNVPFGLCYLSYVEHDRDMTEKFIAKGMRTHRTVAILELNEIVVGKGRVMSVATAREKGILTGYEKPVIQIRAFRGTQARLSNARENGYAFLKDAMKLVAQELGRNRINRRTYLEWFARTMGEQVAILHSENFSHGFITDHNITLDCNIVDFDSVVEMREGKHGEFAKDDLDGSCEGLWKLRDIVCELAGYESEGKDPGIPSYGKLEDLFLKAYLKRMDNETLKKDEVFNTWIEREQAGVRRWLAEDGERL